MTYDDFIKQCKKRILPKECYTERHHIIPKCIGGSNNHDNLIVLTAREHYEAHRLLALENPNIYKLVCAWWNMCQRNSSKNAISPEEYEEARKANAKRITETMSGENNPCFGKTFPNRKGWTEDSKKHQSEIRKKYCAEHPNFQSGEANPMYGRYGKYNPASKKVYDKISGKTWDCVNDCAIEIGVSRSMIQYICQGKRHHEGVDLIYV